MVCNVIISERVCHVTTWTLCSIFNRFIITQQRTVTGHDISFLNLQHSVMENYNWITIWILLCDSFCGLWYMEYIAWDIALSLWLILLLLLFKYPMWYTHQLTFIHWYDWLCCQLKNTYGHWVAEGFHTRLLGSCYQTSCSPASHTRPYCLLIKIYWKRVSAFMFLLTHLRNILASEKSALVSWVYSCGIILLEIWTYFVLYFVRTQF